MRTILILLVLAAVAAYFTRPTEAHMQEAANAVLRDADNPIEWGEGVLTGAAGQRAYSNYQVASRYTITFNDEVVVSCWGAFTVEQCTKTS